MASYPSLSLGQTVIFYIFTAILYKERQPVDSLSFQPQHLGETAKSFIITPEELGLLMALPVFTFKVLRVFRYPSNLQVYRYIQQKIEILTLKSGIQRALKRSLLKTQDSEKLLGMFLTRELVYLLKAHKGNEQAAKWVDG